ncbi:MAG: hypothetical protein AMXMBFR84_06000 [Candidatus Hydrogenedentota bacterium]
MTSPNGTDHAHTNHLVGETSPYLLQHAHNPVDWYPWGEEALNRAKTEDKPIFLSVGYSACHWCHVMEAESFENEAIAKLLNDHFVSIKVDREERPDIDEIYMTSVQLMTGQGGWPMTVFMTPDRKPFFGGTYFPPVDRYGRAGFGTLLNSIIELWKNDRQRALQGAEQITEAIQQAMAPRPAGEHELSMELFDRATRELRGTYDPNYGGFGGAPKFPNGPAMHLLLRECARTGDKDLLDMVNHTLTRMYYGGMWDHLGGGFCRYSVDERWLVPHFEKMLYDNAQLVQVYLEAYQVTDNPLFRKVAEDIFSYQLRDMTDPEGAFYSTEDAQSEGEEGKFYLWTQDEILSVLGDEDGYIFCQYFNIRPNGNFSSHEPYHKGKNVIHLNRTHEAIAESLALDPAILASKIAALKATLLKERDKRVRPGRDDKVIAAWNGLMISGFAKGYQVLGDRNYLAAAEAAARYVLKHMMTDGKLMRSRRDGKNNGLGYLDDYANMGLGFLDLYEATFDPEWFRHAKEFADTLIARYWDEQAGGFYLISDDHEQLIVRTKPAYDGSEPSGNAMTAALLFRLGKMSGDENYLQKARKVLQVNAANMRDIPRGHLRMILEAGFALLSTHEIAIIGNGSELADAARKSFLPYRVIAQMEPSSNDAEVIRSLIPLLRDKDSVDGQDTVYICKDFACRKPVTSVAAMLQELGVQ